VSALGASNAGAVRPRCAVVLVTHQTRDEVLGALASRPAAPHVHRIVVDSGSTDGTAATVRAAHPDVEVVELANVGFGRGANAGIRRTDAPVVVVANADVRFDIGAVETLTSAFDEDAELGAAGPRVRYADGSSQASARSHPGIAMAVAHALLGRLAPDNRWTQRYHQRDRDEGLARDVDWLSGCTLALRRSVAEELGGFDPGYFLYVEDMDLGRRLRDAGWRLRYVPTAGVVHSVGASTRQRRVRSVWLHARSVDRYVAARLRGRPSAVLRPLVPVPVALWAIATWLAERSIGRGGSTTGERPRAGPGSTQLARGTA
jgi:N-acetylglucosaminyl-diphospho-decaprenol L-rhamnosyltransferase